MAGRHAKRLLILLILLGSLGSPVVLTAGPAAADDPPLQLPGALPPLPPLPPDLPLHTGPGCC